MGKTGLLLDVSGIQKYIFGTSKLKQNAGASWIVEHILTEEYLEEKPIYSGGGNALLKFDNETSAKEFARDWSLRILEEYPGLQPLAGLHTSEEYSDDNFGEFLNDCRKALAKTKALYQTQTELSRYGVTAECIHTGGSANYFDTKLTSGDNRSADAQYYSELAKIKHLNDDKAKDSLSNKIDVAKNDIPENFNHIGGKTNDNYRSGIAVVHIDGNEMGHRFQKMKTLREYKELSEKVEKWVEKSVAFVTNKIEKLLKDSDDIRKDLGLEMSDIFPFRPIIIGGDDVTYVCNSGLGLLTAKLFLDKFKELQIEEGITENKLVSACAGVAFVKPSFPFAQAYDLAEDLCRSAKIRYRKFMRNIQNKENYEEPSFIDFHNLHSGIVESIETIREDGYKLNGESLLGRPFGIDKGSESFDFMIKEVNKIKRWSKNKIKELREVVYKGSGAEEMFFAHLKKQNKDWIKPELPHAPRANFGNPTYLDYCEFLDVVPESLLDTKYWEGK
ncbi:MAG: hypothetical protein H8E71_04065 [Candidatus Marinimicrobia bacterium]|nr:hypothetical protein [Candidatus Neomarinimicrobiota bacterium]